MVKVLIYSSKEIYDKASYEGRAEAHLIAYREDDDCYRIVKNRTSRYIPSWERLSHVSLRREIEWAEQQEWNREVEAIVLQNRYKNHPFIELSKNNVVDTRSDQ